MTPEEVEAIASGLTKAQREALSEFTEEWLAGPQLSDGAIAALPDLRVDGLVEREFYDTAPVSKSYSRGHLKTRIAACWHFRLTPLGLAVAAHLRGKE